MQADIARLIKVANLKRYLDIPQVQHKEDVTRREPLSISLLSLVTLDGAN